LCQSVQLALVSVEQLLEGVPVTGDVSGQQLGIRPADSFEAPHKRTLSGFPGSSLHKFAPLGIAACYEAAFRVTSAMSERLLPSTWPSVDTHTSTLDVGVGLSTLIVFEPAFSVVAG